MAGSSFWNSFSDYNMGRIPRVELAWWWTDVLLDFLFVLF